MKHKVEIGKGHVVGAGERVFLFDPQKDRIDFEVGTIIRRPEYFAVKWDDAEDGEPGMVTIITPENAQELLPTSEFYTVTKSYQYDPEDLPEGHRRAVRNVWLFIGALMVACILLWLALMFLGNK